MKKLIVLLGMCAFMLTGCGMGATKTMSCTYRNAGTYLTTKMTYNIDYQGTEVKKLRVTYDYHQDNMDTNSGTTGNTDVTGGTPGNTDTNTGTTNNMDGVLLYVLRQKAKKWALKVVLCAAVETSVFEAINISSDN